MNRRGEGRASNCIGGSCRGSEGREAGMERRAVVQVTFLRKGRHGNQPLCSLTILPRVLPSPAFPSPPSLLSYPHILPMSPLLSPSPALLETLLSSSTPPPSPCSPLPVPPPPGPRSSWLPTVITKPGGASSCRFCRDKIACSTTLAVMRRRRWKRRQRLAMSCSTSSVSDRAPSHRSFLRLRSSLADRGRAGTMAGARDALPLFPPP